MCRKSVTIWKRAFQATGKARAKDLRQEHVCGAFQEQQEACVQAHGMCGWGVVVADESREVTGTDGKPL